ncbi:RNA polymerase sigma factor [Spongiimicrobium sp. 3-5]|uniref:RNA polymerase sigma factor n=1 Tax=Spongiimicrobium sp. 3-5 TaxID=3332596 RepID=UPI003980BA7C
MKAINLYDFTRNTLSDEQVVKRVLAGEKELYELLMRRYNQKLYRVVIGYLRDKQDIEDVMQEAYLKAYEKLYQFRFDASFSTWLIRIAINEALIKIRQRGKYVPLNTDLIGRNTKNLETHESFGPLDPEKKFIQKETALMLEQTIQKLDSKYRVVYILRTVEGMSLKEIGDCLNLTNANVKVRLHRAKKMVKEELYQLSITKDVFEFGSTKCDVLVVEVMSKILV